MAHRIAKMVNVRAGDGNGLNTLFVLSSSHRLGQAVLGAESYKTVSGPHWVFKSHTVSLDVLAAYI